MPKRRPPCACRPCVQKGWGQLNVKKMWLGECHSINGYTCTDIMLRTLLRYIRRVFLVSPLWHAMNCSGSDPALHAWSGKRNAVTMPCTSIRLELTSSGPAVRYSTDCGHGVYTFVVQHCCLCTCKSSVHYWELPSSGSPGWPTGNQRRFWG